MNSAALHPDPVRSTKAGPGDPLPGWGSDSGKDEEKDEEKEEEKEREEETETEGGKEHEHESRGLAQGRRRASLVRRTAPWPALLIDQGNSYCKACLADAGGLLGQPTLWRAGETLPPLPSAVAVRIVSTRPDCRTELAQALRAQGLPAPTWFTSADVAPLLTLAYHDPGRFGADRAAALLGAWERVRAAVIVADAGTALTIDVLDDAGRQVGAALLPGLSLMRRSLAAGTAAVRPQATPSPGWQAHDTDAAVANGIFAAAAGAIGRFARHWPRARLLLCGGDAPALLPLLTGRAEHRPWLVLEGLLASLRSRHDAGP